MKDAPALAPDSDQVSVVAPRSILTTWRERIRSRWKLAQMAQESPRLLEDIGLTKQQVETEVAKRFWQR